MNASFTTLLQHELIQLDGVGRRRNLRSVSCRNGNFYGAIGQPLIDASSNDYLGLSQHSLVRARAAEWALCYGAGAPSSRLVTGTRDITLALESKIAAFKRCEAALLFSTGFQANATVIPALARVGNSKAGKTTIFSDALNHASIIHGIRSAHCTVEIFRHNDIDHLEELLESHTGHKLIITESVFSMDGDRSNLPMLVRIAEQYGAILYVDEAHATGVLGPEGRGLAAECGGIDIVMGTLGKAVGSFGAYIAGSQVLIDYLVNRCAGFIYTTALPPPVLGAVDAALDLIPTLDNERHQLVTNAQRLRDALNISGIGTLDSTTQIVPAIIGSEKDALAAAKKLGDAGILAVAIRPPTVSPGTSRLRFALSSSIDESNMGYLIDEVSRL